MNVMRFNLIDPEGTVSFVAPCHALKVLTAACARDPRDLDSLLEYTEPFDPALKPFVRNGLAVFDEHNTRENLAAIREALEHEKPRAAPFRVLDARTREASLTPVHAGLVIFNLPAKRIVQVQNAYAEVERQDRGRVRAGGSPTERLYHYRLPEDWSLVP
jgi:hypothetical protein